MPFLQVLHFLHRLNQARQKKEVFKQKSLQFPRLLKLLWNIYIIPRRDWTSNTTLYSSLIGASYSANWEILPIHILISLLWKGALLCEERTHFTVEFPFYSPKMLFIHILIEAKSCALQWQTLESVLYLNFIPSHVTCVSLSFSSVKWDSHLMVLWWLNEIIYVKLHLIDFE